MSCIIASIYQGGLLIGSNSINPSGVITENRSFDPILKIDEKTVLFSNKNNNLTQKIQEILIVNKFRIEKSSDNKPCVRNHVQYLKHYLHDYQSGDFPTSIIAGYDRFNAAQIYMLEKGGSIINNTFVSLGNDNEINSYCDINFKTKMSFEECFKFISSALTASLYRTTNGNGTIRLCRINETGIEKKKICPDKNYREILSLKSPAEVMV
mmetsp:Transcript_44434/g.69478  ORF Transcript_44434/g.69478 Transcript_44434/m.69478 type:complete len:210 (-) Transcript_44434:632-1261(-)